MGKPHWMQLPAGGKLFATGPTGPHRPLIELGVNDRGQWIMDDGLLPAVGN